MSLSDLSVMVVEDHSFQRSIALRLLAGLGIERAFEAANGREALERVLAMPEKPDVLLVDLDLPEMDGIELIGHVASRRLARAVVVVGTAVAMVVAIVALSFSLALSRAVNAGFG